MGVWMSAWGKGKNTGQKRKCQQATLIRQKTGRVSDGLWLSRAHRAGGTTVASVGDLSRQKLIPPMISLQNFRQVCLQRKAKAEEEEKGGYGKNIIAIQDQMGWLSDVVTMSFCNCTAWLTLKWVTTEKTLSHYSTGEPRPGEGDCCFFLILIGNWEGSFSDV